LFLVRVHAEAESSCSPLFVLIDALNLHHPIEHRFQQLADSLVATKKLMQHLVVYGNLGLGYPLHPLLVLNRQPNHCQEDDGLSSSLGHPTCRIYTIIPDATLYGDARFLD